VTPVPPGPEQPGPAASSQESSWDPDQYSRFAREREQPFWDLCALLEPVDSPTVVDLGCGDGRLTSELHRRLGAASTTGIDSSPTMLDSARDRGGGRLRFVAGDLETWSGEGVDVVLSNAALHWVPDHATVLGRWRDGLAPGGQLAVQMPTNADHPSHRVVGALAAEWLGADAPPDTVVEHVRAPEWYSQTLYDLGLERQHVRMQVYGHLLGSTADVVEWTKGTSLTRFKPLLSADRYEQFVDEYRRRLVAELGDHRPYFYTFKRILLWGALPGWPGTQPAGSALATKLTMGGDAT
jgi:trans-aconitate 2-methyltransferase